MCCNKNNNIELQGTQCNYVYMKATEQSCLWYESASSALKAHLWKIFGFGEVKGRNDVDKRHTIVKLCSCFPSEEEKVKQPVVAATGKQRSIKEAMSKIPPYSQKAKWITKSNVTFIIKDLRLFLLRTRARAQTGMCWFQSHNRT